jgi:mRNA interferase RelE/StbE
VPKNVRFELHITEQARDQLRALPKPVRVAIGRRLDALQNSFSGDIKKLTAREHKYRLRVGAFRVLFQLEGPRIIVYAVKQRKEAYE